MCPHPQEADCCCLGVFHDVTSSLFPSCVFAICIFVLSYCCRQYGWQVHLHWCLHIDGRVCGVSSSLQLLWNSFTAEACHRNWSLMWIIRHCCAVDLMPRCICRERLFVFSSFHEAFLVYAESWLCLFQWWLAENLGRLLIDRNNLTLFPVLGFDSGFFVWLGTVPSLRGTAGNVAILHFLMRFNHL